MNRFGRIVPAVLRYGNNALLIAAATVALGQQLTASPTISDGGIVNAATPSGGIAPGTLVVIYGLDMTDGTSCLPSDGCSPVFDGNGKLQTKMAGAQVTINGTAAPMIYATPIQVGIQIPSETAGTSAIVQVSVNGQSSPPKTISLGTSSPGIFTLNQTGAGPGTITHADAAGTQVSPGSPAVPGEVLIIYATGLGPVLPAVPTGTLPASVAATATQASVTIDGIAAEVQFSGLSGCCVGVDQVNVVVPQNVRLGSSIPVTLSIGDKQSNTVTIPTGALIDVASAAAPAPISFGDVAVGSSSTQSITLTNGATADLIVSGLSLTGNGFILNGFDIPATLQTGQTITFSVTFGPTQSGSATGTVTILSGAGGTIVIPLSGNGIAGHFVDMVWTPSTSAVAAYNIYRSSPSPTSTSQSPYSKIGSAAGSSYTDTNVSAAQTYSYQVTAVDANGLESAPSNTATVAIPSP